VSTIPVGWRSDSLGPADTWNTLTVDIGIRRRHLSKAGTAIGAPIPAASYRLERSNRTGRWKTVIFVLSVERQPAYMLSGMLRMPAAFPVARMEDDEDGTPVRVYDTRNQLVKPLPAAAVTFAAPVASIVPPRSMGREWIETFVATAAGRPKRLLALEGRFGPGTPVGLLIRYTKRDGDLVHEVLVDPRLAVPVEEKISRTGTLTGYRTFSYGPAPNEAVVRAAIHAESTVSTGVDDRSVVDATFSNIRLELRR
jgi:hypothetical protein